MIGRRELFALVGGAVAWPRPAPAQQAKTPTIGVLLLGSAQLEPFLSDFRRGLRDRGYTDGVNIRLEIRSADGNAGLLAERAAELVRLKVDIIVAFQTPACTAANLCADGNVSCINPTRLPTVSATPADVPVLLPPGRA